jgi:hypothetical protein
MLRMRDKRTGDWNHSSMVLRERNGRAGDGKRRVGLKYCGGCNPHYDRIALAEDLKARLGSEIEWASLEAGDLDLVLAIEGCKTACADLSPFEGVEVRIITCPEEGEGLISQFCPG